MDGVRRKGRPRAADSSETRRRILLAARACFGSSGYEQTTNKDIARAAGITQAAIYNHFASKPDLFVAVFRETQASVFGRFEEVLTACPGVIGRVKAVLEVSADLHAEDRSLASFVAVAPIEIQRHRDVRESLGDDAFVARRFFRRLVESGEGVSPQVDRGALANALMAVASGFSQFGATVKSVRTHRLAIESFKDLLDGKLLEPATSTDDPQTRDEQQEIRLWTLLPSNGSETRTRVLLAARACFGTSGYDETTNKDIGTAAGLTHTAMYRHFASKRDLFVAVYRETQGSVFGRFHQAVAVQHGVLDRVKAVLEVSADLHAEDRSLASFMAMAPIEIQRHGDLRESLGDDVLVAQRFFRWLVESGEGVTPAADSRAVGNAFMAVASGFSLFGATVKSARAHRLAIDSFNWLVDRCLYPAS
jgi:AcrR family transcriptional regulator